MRNIWRIILSAVCIMMLSVCGPIGDERVLDGEMVSIEGETVTIKPFSASAVLRIPYYAELADVDKVSFSTGIWMT